MSGEIRREDLPPKVVKEIEDRFHAELPGYEVKFAGDIEEELPADVQRSLEQLDAISKESMVNGTCIDCGGQVPGVWPPDNEEDVPDGWNLYVDTKTGAPSFLVCGTCDSLLDEDGDDEEVERDWDEDWLEEDEEDDNDD